jgi:hypothetical protein
MLGVATTFSEARTLRTEEDITATVIETRDDVRWLKQAVQALLDHAGVEVEPDEGADE